MRSTTKSSDTRKDNRSLSIIHHLVKNDRWTRPGPFPAAFSPDPSRGQIANAINTLQMTGGWDSDEKVGIQGNRNRRRSFGV